MLRASFLSTYQGFNYGYGRGTKGVECVLGVTFVYYVRDVMFVIFFEVVMLYSQGKKQERGDRKRQYNKKRGICKEDLK